MDVKNGFIRQKKSFAGDILNGNNHTKANTHAGYSDLSAERIGRRLAKDVDVLCYIEKPQIVRKLSANCPQIVTPVVTHADKPLQHG